MANENNKRKKTHFNYKPVPGAQGRGAGDYPIDDPGMLGGMVESARVGGFNQDEFDRQRALAKQRRDKGE